MRYPNFIGGSYKSQSSFVNAERCVNFFPEIQDVPGSKARIVLYPTPGILTFADLVAGRNRAIFYQNGRAFSVSGDQFFELFPNGTSTNYGTVADDGRQATISANGVQLFITGGGNGYVFTLATNTYAQITAAGFPGASMGAFLDGWFIALVPSSRQINVSSLYNGLAWNASAYTILSQDTDNLVSMLTDHKQLWLFGGQHGHVYEDSGNPNFPFEPVLSSGAQVEHGCPAEFGPSQLDNTVFFVGGDQRGEGIGWRLEGYLPRRITTHAVEHEWQSYSRIDDLISWTYQASGHAFWMVYFPTADKMWCYDVASGFWHERTWFGGMPTMEHAHRGATHVFAFGKHLVGDRENGKIYEMSSDFLTDDGDVIRRVRQAPHISNEQKMIYYKQFQLDMQVGIGLDQIVEPTDDSL